MGMSGHKTAASATTAYCNAKKKLLGPATPTKGEGAATRKRKPADAGDEGIGKAKKRSKKVEENGEYHQRMVHATRDSLDWLHLRACDYIENIHLRRVLTRQTAIQQNQGPIQTTLKARQPTTQSSQTSERRTAQ